MVAFGARLSLRWDGLTHFAPVDPVASPATIRRELYSFRFIDTLLLDEIEPGADCDRAVTAASCGKLILGGSHAPDALTLLAVLAEQAASRTALGHGLSAIMETRLSAAGAPEAALLPIEPLVGVLERSGARTRLAAAALAAGFRSLNDVATPTDREAA
jgi:hypothetical protein